VCPRMALLVKPLEALKGREIIARGGNPPWLLSGAPLGL
jgi:hypothetical protein